MENIHLATELMKRYDRARTVPRCTVKIDLRKAYDTICWDFLEDVLLGLNFHPIFVERVMECVTSLSYSIMINGSPHGFFQGKRGLRQGDPMSPTPLFFVWSIFPAFSPSKLEAAGLTSTLGAPLFVLLT